MQYLNLNLYYILHWSNNEGQLSAIDPFLAIVFNEI